MPCDTITTVNVDFAGAKAEHFNAALRALGLSGEAERFYGTLRVDGYPYQLSGGLQNGKLTIQTAYGHEEITATIKRQYAASMATALVRRAGWQVKQEGNKLVCTRR